MSQEKVMWVLFLWATWKSRITFWESASFCCTPVAQKDKAVCIHRYVSMLLNLASPESATFSRAAAVTMNNRGEKATLAICSKEEY